MSHRQPTDHRSSAQRPPDATRRDARFDDAFRAWASRPPATSAEEAGRRVTERVPARTRFPELRRLAVAAVLVAAVGAALVLRWAATPSQGPATTPGAATVSPTVGTAAVPDGDVLVIDLDSETTLYLNLSGPDPS